MKFPQQHNITKLSRQIILSFTKYTVMIVMFSFVVMKGIFNIILSQAANQTKANTPVNVSDQSKIVPKKTTKPITNAFDAGDDLPKVNNDRPR